MQSKTQSSQANNLPMNYVKYFLILIRILILLTIRFFYYNTFMRDNAAAVGLIFPNKVEHMVRTN